MANYQEEKMPSSGYNNVQEYKTDECAEENGRRLLALFKKKKTSIDKIQSLIAKGANVNLKGDTGVTLLHLAVKRGYFNVVLMLLAAEGIDICAKDNNRETALMTACMGTNIEIVEALLAALKKTPNFDINDKNFRGVTALMYSC
jgi:ankyrin repeat protein